MNEKSIESFGRVVQKVELGRTHGVTGVRTVPAAVNASRDFVRPGVSERVARLAVLGQSVTFRARVDFASALLASNVPDTRNGVTVLALTESGTTTAVVEVNKCINALVITTDQAGNRASGETLRARGNVTRTVLALLSVNAFAFMALLVVIITGRLSGLRRCGRWLGAGTGWGRVAAERVVGPVPTVTALRRGEITGRLVRSTAAQSRVPRPAAGAVFVGRWTGRIAWTPVGKADVFAVPLEFATSTVVPVGENERNSQNQEKDASNERHSER